MWLQATPSVVSKRLLQKRFAAGIVAVARYIGMRFLQCELIFMNKP